MITHDARRSLSRGNNPVPSRWLATLATLEIPPPGQRQESAIPSPLRQYAMAIMPCHAKSQDQNGSAMSQTFRS